MYFFMTKLGHGLRSWGMVSEVGTGCPKLGHTIDLGPGVDFVHELAYWRSMAAGTCSTLKKKRTKKPPDPPPLTI